MSDAATPLPLDAASDAQAFAELGEDWARVLLQRQVLMLGQLAEDGLEVARAIKRQATGEAAEADSDGPAREAVKGDLVAAYARVSRAVRLTLMLQAKVIEELQRLDRLEASVIDIARVRADAAREGHVEDRMDLVQRAVGRVAKAEGETADAAERLMAEAGERLEDIDVYGDLLSRPMSEFVDRICRDLGLSPDWPRLAQEAWAQAEIGGGEAGAPLASLTAEALANPPAAVSASSPVEHGAGGRQPAGGVPPPPPDWIGV